MRSLGLRRYMSGMPGAGRGARAEVVSGEVGGGAGEEGEDGEECRWVE